ncbi:HupE / UreJ protein [Meinhardsimonia xiamenensis]|jgi:hypothetical protein|uniref:HupE / UreJ protein n=2 Tax=Meinhardsimonia xiamenensis TaxID=990712 RepID=A0A1G9EKY5_9RHOB|nr:HupE/UreJ family protein [Meinhardsimonia xiamenensis]PRX33727.1 HupE/UreJ protein [Meinhardsimonia xiamenensis]SDK76675.1 HupE / UreJ protein [Meinhardsimonia xiamenensis]
MVPFKLRGIGRLSSLALALTALLAALLASLGPARAHEIRPAIADIEVRPDSAELTIRLTLETLVSGIDVAGLTDTNEAEGVERYDALRALPPEELEERFRAAWRDLAPRILLRSGDHVLVPELVFVEVGEVGDPGLPRESVIGLRAELPPGDAPVSLSWPAAWGPIALRQMGVEEAEAYTGYLTGGEESAPIPRTGTASESWARTFIRYVVIGFEHIVPLGADHILFVLGLFFFSLRLRPLLYQVTAFTAAHTVTLALATLGVVSVSPALVEPLIAASIVFVAVENIVFPRMNPWRTAIVFGFGLLHGLGFASVLGEIGLSPSRLVTGLVGFNIGVELGQLAVIAAAFLLVGLPFGRRPWYRGVVAVPASAAIALVGGWWFLERTVL